MIAKFVTPSGLLNSAKYTTSKITRRIAKSTVYYHRAAVVPDEFCLPAYDVQPGVSIS